MLRSIPFVVILLKSIKFWGHFDEYANIIRQSKISLNLSRHSNGIKALTGRVWQSMHSGCIVVEESSLATSFFWEPWVHYFPFDNIQELKALLTIFSQETELCSKVSKTTYDWTSSRYNANNIWRYILSKVL